MKREFQRWLTRSRTNFTSFVESLGTFFRSLRPRSGDLGSLIMCPSCGLITSRFKKLCLECGKTLKTV